MLRKSKFTLGLGGWRRYESSESLESGFVLFSENEQDYAYSAENINELPKKVRKLVIF